MFVPPRKSLGFLRVLRVHPRTVRHQKPRSQDEASQISCADFDRFSERYGKRLASGNSPLAARQNSSVGSRLGCCSAKPPAAVTGSKTKLEAGVEALRPEGLLGPAEHGAHR